LFEWSKTSNGILNLEYRSHVQSLTESLFNEQTWGRPINNADNFHFQDNAATASFLYNNIDKVYEELKRIVFIKYNVDISEVLRYNKHILDLYNKPTHTDTFSKNWHSWFFENKKLKDAEVVIETQPTQYTNINDHAKHLFWYGRKSKRCFLKCKEFEYDTYC
jgi:hypothetical protein